MDETATAVKAIPTWVDLSTSDPGAAREWYAKLFGWDVQVTDDPQYGGYAIAQVGGRDVAGIGPKQSAEAPSAWMVYIGTGDAAALGGAVEAAGGRVIAPAFDVGDQGRMAVFQDPAGAFISAWQPAEHDRFHSGAENTFGWAELSARGIEKALPFYERVFGWTSRSTPMGEGMQYIEFQLDGQSVAGGTEMNPMVPEQVPSYWMPYFVVADVDAATAKAKEMGAQELVPPQEFPGLRFSIVQDPQGAAFGLLRMTGR